MATPREPQSDARTNSNARKISPVLKVTESDQGVRRARSVPSSSDRRLSQSAASRSSDPSRPSPSFSARAAASRSTFGSASSSVHVKALHPSSSMAAEKSSGSSLPKDMNMRAKSPSTLQKSKLSSRPGVDKIKVPSSSLKLRAQKGASGAMAGGRTQVMSPAHTHGATAKKKTGAANSAPAIQGMNGVPVKPTEEPKIEEQEVDLLMEFDEMESISTPSIEEHLQERLPDPVDVKYVDSIAHVRSQDDPCKTSFNQERENEVSELVSEEQHEAQDNGEEYTNVVSNVEAHAVKETASETELLKEAVDATKLSKTVSETGLNEAVGETDLSETVARSELKVMEEAREKMEKVMPPKNAAGFVHKWMKDDERKNEAKEESRSNSTAERRSKFMALIGKFEMAQ